MSEYPLCSCDEWWCGPGRHSPECHVVAKFKELEQQFAQARDHVIEQERGIVGRERRIAELEAENERLENLLAEGIHTCSKTCKRPLCQLRREKADLEQQLADLRATCEHQQEIINSFDLVDKARREEHDRGD